MLHLIKKRMALDPLVARKEWNALLEQGLIAGWAFEKLLEDVSEAAAQTKCANTMPLIDLVAHVADVNYGVANILEAFTRGRSLTYDERSLYRGAGGRLYGEVCKDHSESLLRLADSTAKPLNPSQVSWHFEYGRLTGKEWLATILLHYEYHTKQVERIRGSRAFLGAREDISGRRREAVK